MSQTNNKKSHNRLAAISAILLSSLAPLCAANYPTKPYEASMDSFAAGTTTRSHVWNDGQGHQRSESTVAGVVRPSIMDFNKKMIYAIDDQRKTVTAMPLNDPSQPDPSVKWTPIGAKVIDGHPCQGKKALMGGQQVEYWEGTDTGCTVAVVTNGKTTMKLVSWKATQPNASLFTLPAGYKVMDMAALMKSYQPK